MRSRGKAIDFVCLSSTGRICHATDGTIGGRITCPPPPPPGPSVPPQAVHHGHRWSSFSMHTAASVPTRCGRRGGRLGAWKRGWLQERAGGRGKNTCAGTWRSRGLFSPRGASFKFGRIIYRCLREYAWRRDLGLLRRGRLPQARKLRLAFFAIYI